MECYSSRFLRCCEAARLISRGLLALYALALLPIASSTTVMAKDKFVALGTGSPNGTYFPVGRGIYELINDSRLEARGALHRLQHGRFRLLGVGQALFFGFA